jgi:hypothetical protein
MAYIYFKAAIFNKDFYRCHHYMNQPNSILFHLLIRLALFSIYGTMESLFRK